MQQTRAGTVRNQSSSDWERPNYGLLKCNVDAAFNERAGITSIECCVRNNNGEFVMSQTSWKQANLSILEGEATSLLEGLHMAIVKGWENVILESMIH